MNPNVDDVIFSEDMVFQILLWLPVMSILRFKSVCKSWRSLIETPSFIDQYFFLHRHLDEDHNNYRIILFSSIYRADSRGIHLSLLSDDHTFEVPLIYNRDYSPEQSFFYGLNLVSCNGILCLHLHSECYVDNKLDTNIFLWNPATKKSITLPQSPFPPPRLTHRVNVFIGFGFNPETSDYVLVRIFLFGLQFPGVSHVDTYSLNEDAWRIVDDVLPCDYILRSTDPKSPYRDETYCWVGRKDPPSEDVKVLYDNFIVSFDFRNGVFGTVPLPDVESVKTECVPHLSIVRDKLACVNGSNDFMCHEIWVLNEYGVKESWTRLFNIGPFSDLRHLRLSMDGNFFLCLIKSRQLYIYNIVTHELKSINIQRSGPRHDIDAIVYKESLVSPERKKALPNSRSQVV